MSYFERQLLTHLQTFAVRYGEYRLASGRINPHYVDVKRAMLAPSGAYLFGQVVFARTCDEPVDAIGGMATGAIPLVTAAITAYHAAGQPVDGFWVQNRQAEKTHGVPDPVVGWLSRGMQVVVVEDVVSTGRSVLAAVETVLDRGAEVVLVLAVVDRGAEAAALFAARGIPYQAVFQSTDLGVDRLESK